jgi:NTE family protein
MNLGSSAGETGAPICPTEVRLEPLPRQVVTLALLSEDVPDLLIGEQIARFLCVEAEASVVLVELRQQGGGSKVEEDAHPEVFLNGEFHLPSEVRKTDGGFHFISLGVGSDPPTAAGIASLVSQLSRHFRHVLVQTRVDERPAAWLYELFLRSNLAYLFLKATTASLNQLDLVLWEARARCRGGNVLVRPVVCLAEGEQIDGLDTLIQDVAGPVHLFIRGCPERDRAKDADPQSAAAGSFRADVRRIAREIGGCLTGLALSSGAAKGFAHIGVIQILEEEGIEVDMVAGSSMGAYIGALWAHGCDGRELERLARELEAPWSLLSLIDPAFPPRRGLLRGFAVKKRLMRTIGHALFSELKRPLRIVAANLATLERVVFASGEVATAVHASAAVPGICVPVTIDGETFTDGGIVDPLPVDILREMGVTRIIAVTVIPTPGRIRRGIQAELETARHDRTKGRKLFGRSLPADARMNYFARGNLVEILMRSVHSGQIRMAENSCRLADLVLRPDIYDDRWADYRHPGKFIALGREAAERHLVAIKALVSRKETSRESTPAAGPVATIA